MAHTMALYSDFTKAFFAVKMSHVPDFRLSPRWTQELRSSGVLFSAKWYHIISYPLGSIGPIFRDPLKLGPIGCSETSVRNYRY
jgi:hypothetical protein